MNFDSYGTGDILGTTFTSPTFYVKTPTPLGSGYSYQGSVNTVIDSAYGGQANPAVTVTVKGTNPYIKEAEARFERYEPKNTTIKWVSVAEGEKFEVDKTYRLAVFLQANRKYVMDRGYEVTLYDSSNRSFDLTQETGTGVYKNPYVAFYGPSFTVTQTDPWTGSEVGQTDGEKWIKLKVSKAATGGYDEAALENLLSQKIIDHKMTESGKDVYVLYETDALKVKNLTLDFRGDEYGFYPLGVLKYLTNLETLTFRPNDENVAESEMYDVWSSSDPHNFKSLDLTANVRLNLRFFRGSDDQSRRKY